MKYRIGISGSYGGRNLGDEAILEGILKELRVHKEIEPVVFSYNPADTEKRHKVYAIPTRELHKDQMVEELKRLDLFILGGGGILFEGQVEKFLRDAIWAKELGIPVFVYAISVGPLKTPETKKVVAEALNQFDFLSVRESESKRTLHEIGVTKPIEVTADPAFLIEPQEFTSEMLRAEGVDKQKPLCGFSIREPGPAAPDLNIDHYHTMLANAADFIVERCQGEVHFIPMEQDRDPQHSHAIISKMLNAKYAKVLNGDYTPGEILGLIGHMHFAIGMRLHFLIFALLQHVPFIPLPYATKVSGLLEDLEMPMPSIDAWNTGRLCAVIDRAWDNRESLKKQLEEKEPLIKEKAKKTSQLLFDFLKNITPKATCPP